MYSRQASLAETKKLLKCSVFHQCPPVSLNMYPLTVYNMDAVIICRG